MQSTGRVWWLVLLAACGLAAAAGTKDFCTICGQPIDGKIYLVTDAVTGKDQMVCSNCLPLPRCFICGLPVRDHGTELADGRHMCARDGKTAVFKAADARRLASGVEAELDRLFARFTAFPTNVDVTVLDRIDVDAIYQPDGHDFESPDLLGCIEAITNAGQKRYAMRLLTGLPRVELQATAAHEFAHAWVGEQVRSERHKEISRDAEEGFCELVAYLLMDSQNETGQKKFILNNHYTRGQVQLFIAAEQRFGFNQILDWMQYGAGAELVGGRLEAIRDVNSPARAAAGSTTPGQVVPPLSASARAGMAAPDTLKLQGILWANPPAAIINNRTVFANDRFKLKIGGTEMILRCLEIQKSWVRIRHEDSGKQDELHLQP